MKGLIFLMMFALAGCEAQPSATLPDSDEPLSNASFLDAGNVAAPVTSASERGNETGASPASNWTYRENKDEMRGASARLATVSASEPIILAFPYGQSTPELTVRSDPKYGSDTFITANGQVLCRSYDEDTVSVKFDAGPIEEWGCVDAESGSSEIVFIQRHEAFLAKLKKAKRVIIEADMYNAGRVQMTFDVEGLRWPMAPKKGA